MIDQVINAEAIVARATSFKPCETTDEKVFE